MWPKKSEHFLDVVCVCPPSHLQGPRGPNPKVRDIAPRGRTRVHLKVGALSYILKTEIEVVGNANFCVHFTRARARAWACEMHRAGVTLQTLWKVSIAILQEAEKTGVQWRVKSGGHDTTTRGEQGINARDG